MKFYTTIALALPALSSASSLKSLLSSHSKLSTLHNLLDQFDLLDTFNKLENITVIAPTNQAYLDLANWGFNVSQIPATIARALFQYHILNGEHDSRSIDAHAQVVHTHLQPPVLTNVTNGAAVKLSKTDGKIVTESGLGVVGGVEEKDFEFDGGILHTLNASMVLPHNITLTAQMNGIGRLLEVMNQAGLVTEFEALKDVTMFFPQDKAFEGLDIGAMSKMRLASMLRGHIIPNQVLYGEVVGKKETHKALNGQDIIVKRPKGGDLSVNGFKVLKEDVILYAGVAHIIGELLFSADGATHAHDRSYLHLDTQSHLRSI